MIAKLVNGYPVQCPKRGEDGAGVYHTNLPRYYETHPDAAAAAGYYPMMYTDKPDGDYAPLWELQNGQIVQVWTEYTPQPEPEDPVATRLEMIEECLLELSEVLYA